MGLQSLLSLLLLLLLGLLFFFLHGANSSSYSADACICIPAELIRIILFIDYIIFIKNDTMGRGQLKYVVNGYYQVILERNSDSKIIITVS